MNFIQAFATNNLCYKSAQPMKPVGILIHSTGAANPNLKRYVNCPSECGVNPNKNYWDIPMPEGFKLCVHGFIGYDKDKRVRYAQILPYNYASWGCGRGSKGSFNYNPNGHIQIEICEDDLNNREYFNQIWNCAIEVCVDLCKQYNLDPLGKNVIVSHKEANQLGYASPHVDPDYWFKKFGKTMSDLRSEVNSKMNSVSDSNLEKATYIIQVGAFNDLSKASAYNSKLQKYSIDGVPVKSFVKTSNGATKYIVQAGAFSNQHAATTYANKLKQLKIDGVSVNAIVKPK